MPFSLTMAFSRSFGEHGVQVHLGGTDRRHDGAHDVLQIRLVPVFLTDNLLPVPLVHIDGVEVVHVLVAADSVHVAVEALAHAETVVFQGLALPLGQRLDDLHLDAAVLGVEGDLPLDAVQIVVQAGRSLDEERCRHAVQVQRGTQGVGKQPLHRADGALGVVQVQRGRVVFRNDDLAHSRLPLSCCPRAAESPRRGQLPLIASFTDMPMGNSIFAICSLRMLPDH